MKGFTFIHPIGDKAVSTETKRKVTQILIIIGLFIANAAYLILSPLFPT